MAKAYPVFSHALCISCGKCAKFCPMECITMTKEYEGDERHYPQKTGRACLGCGQCAKECPAGAISMTAGVPY